MSICVEEEQREVFAAFVWQFVVDNKQSHSLNAWSQTSSEWGAPPQKFWSGDLHPFMRKELSEQAVYCSQVSKVAGLHLLSSNC